MPKEMYSVRQVYCNVWSKFFEILNAEILFYPMLGKRKENETSFCWKERREILSVFFLSDKKEMRFFFNRWRNIFTDIWEFVSNYNVTRQFENGSSFLFKCDDRHFDRYLPANWVGLIFYLFGRDSTWW